MNSATNKTVTQQAVIKLAVPGTGYICFDGVPKLAVAVFSDGKLDLVGADLGDSVYWTPTSDEWSFRFGLTRASDFDFEYTLDAKLVEGASSDGADDRWEISEKGMQSDIWSDLLSKNGLTRTDETTAFRAATLYVEAFSSHAFPDARWAQVELSPQLVGRIKELRDLCRSLGLADVREFGAPAAWSGEQQWRPDMPHLRVSPEDFWYEVRPKNVDAEVRTQAVTIDTMVALLDQTQSGQHDTGTFKWIDGKLYCDGSDAETLAEAVVDYLDEEKEAMRSENA
ncbi:hypothetical protein [Paraburkholderia sp. SIMBA_054]|uniref:hypothetical protein n=1 Tax=Paraburkholderia sp. SIMBA_054 TaxID=3085795 RepID=UPI00397B943A